MTKSNEYAAFSDFTRKLLKVPHSEIKAKLDAEKKEKANKPKHKKKAPS